MDIPRFWLFLFVIFLNLSLHFNKYFVFFLYLDCKYNLCFCHFLSFHRVVSKSFVAYKMCQKLKKCYIALLWKFDLFFVCFGMRMTTKCSFGGLWECQRDWKMWKKQFYFLFFLKRKWAVYRIGCYFCLNFMSTKTTW